MSTDDDLRRLERAAAAAPDDAAGWLLLATACERAGRRREAARAVVRAHRLAPDDPERARRLAEVGRADGLWPCERGDARGSQSSPMHGPDAGVMRWRLALSHDAIGRPLVDPRGGLFVNTWSSLLKVDPDGRRADPLPGDAAFLPAAPVLRRGEPRIFDPFTNLPRPLAAVGEGPLGPRLLLVEADGSVVATSDRVLLALGPDDAARWRASLVGPIHAAALGPAGPVVLCWLSTDGAGRHALQAQALDRDRGARRWAWGSPRPASRGRPATVGGCDVAIAEDGTALVRLEGRTVVWTDEVVVADALVALDGATGALRWSRALDSPSGPALHAGRALVTTDRAVLDLDLATGEPRWRLDVRGANPPTLDGRGVAYLSTGEGQLLSVGPGGDVRWRLQVPGVGRLGPVSLGDDGWAYATFGRDLIALR